MPYSGSPNSGAKSVLRGFALVAAVGVVLMVVNLVLKYSLDIITPLGPILGWAVFFCLIGVLISGIVVLAQRSTPTSTTTATPPGTLAPGWYPDQNDPDLMRFHDGRSWTSGTAPRTPDK